MRARVADVMTKDVVAVRASASFKEIAARLREQRVSAFPVLDADNKVIGMVSEADLLPKEALEAGYEGHPGPLSGIRHRSEQHKATAMTVADGVVTLEGVPETAVMGQRIASAVRRMEGVIALREEFTYFPGVRT